MSKKNHTAKKNGVRTSKGEASKAARVLASKSSTKLAKSLAAGVVSNRRGRS